MLRRGYKYVIQAILYFIKNSCHYTLLTFFGCDFDKLFPIFDALSFFEIKTIEGYES